jgi:carbamoyltransferase
MLGAFLGPRFDDDEIRAVLAAAGQPYSHHDDPGQRDRVVARAIAEGAIVGWFTGRLEFGPRALGHRSILADARDATAVRRINDRIKGREGFRPFAPAVLESEAGDWFDLHGELPYMLVTAHVRGARTAGPDRSIPFAEQLALERSPVPACTHVDGSARVQTVDPERNPEFHGLIRAFHEHTGCPVVLNTSFNRAGEPIVATPDQALTCARAAGLDLLVMEHSVVRLDDRGSRS